MKNDGKEIKPVFHCERCGLCCVGLDKKEITKSLHDGDGVCRYLDRDTMSCTIYETRPIFCRVDEYYDRFLTDKMSREEYISLTLEACRLKKKEWEECGHDLRRVGRLAPEMPAEKKSAIEKSLKAAENEG